MKRKTNNWFRYDIFEGFYMRAKKQFELRSHPTQSFPYNLKSINYFSVCLSFCEFVSVYFPFRIAVFSHRRTWVFQLANEWWNFGLMGTHCIIVFIQINNFWELHRIFELYDLPLHFEIDIEILWKFVFFWMRKRF